MSDKVPFLITLVLAIIGWAVTHLVDELTATPMLEIRQENRTGSPAFFDLTVTNVTRDKVIRDLVMLVTVPEGETLNSFTVTPIQPASEGDRPSTRAGRTGSFVFPEIQPGEAFNVEASYSGPTPPAIRIELASGPVRIVEPSLETFLVRHELEILLVLVVIGVTTLVLISVFGFRRGKSGGHALEGD